MVYLSADIGWPPHRIEKPFRRQLEAGFVDYDADTDVMLIVSALKYQAPENPTQAKHAVKKLMELPDCSRLFARFAALVDTLSPYLAELLPERFRNPSANSSRNLREGGGEGERRRSHANASAKGGETEEESSDASDVRPQPETLPLDVIRRRIEGRTR
jgi:hypothetical protein